MSYIIEEFLNNCSLFFFCLHAHTMPNILIYLCSSLISPQQHLQVARAERLNGSTSSNDSAYHHQQPHAVSIRTRMHTFLQTTDARTHKNTDTDTHTPTRARTHRHVYLHAHPHAHAHAHTLSHAHTCALHTHSQNCPQHFLERFLSSPSSHAVSTRATLKHS